MADKVTIERYRAPLRPAASQSFVTKSFRDLRQFTRHLFSRLYLASHLSVYARDDTRLYFQLREK